VQRTRKYRVAQLDLLVDDRAHVVLELHAPGPWCWRRWRILAQFLELALCQVHHQVSDALLELRAPLVRQLLQVAEPAPRPPVPLTLLLELRVQLVLLDRRRSEAGCWLLAFCLEQQNYFDIG